MSELNGKLVICDRCGKSCFLKCTGEGAADGGYTRWNKFEATPEGWDWHGDTGRLCPECNRVYLSIIKNFMSKEEQ